MRILLAILMAVVCMGVAAQSSSAQQAEHRSSPAVLEAAYRAWQQARSADEKIEAGERVLTLERGSEDWSLPVPRARVRAEVSGALGSLYVGRAQGVRADNLEKGIGYLQAALGVWTRDGDPVAWASAHNDLGVAYWQRVRGARADNQENAIANFEAAQTVFTGETYPDRWAQLQNNLAIVYSDRVNGDRAANLEESIRHFEGALSIVTRDGNPLGWAATQNNLANVYGKRISGDQADNREMAIKHLEAALSVFSREAQPLQWAQAQNNLGLAYLARTRGDKAENRARAVGSLEATLSVFTREATPQQWAQAHHNLGQAYAQGSGVDDRRKAIASFEDALSVFTRDAAPLDHLRTSRLLGRVLLDSGEWARVAPVHASARQAFLILLGQGVSDAETRTIIAEVGSLFADAAYAAVQRGQPELAFELASEGRARLLSMALKLQTLRLPAEQRQRLDELRAALHPAEQAVEAAYGTERAAAIDKLAALRRELYALVESGTRAETSALAEARGLAAGGAVVVMPIVTSYGGKLLVVARSQGGSDLSATDAPALTTQRLAALLIGGDDPFDGWIGSYVINYMQGDEQRRRWPEWLAAVDGIGGELWSLFGGKLDAALKEKRVDPNARLVWLPSGWLGILPVGLTRDPGSGARLADTHEIVYAPSLGVLAAGDDVAHKQRRATLAAIANPTGDLPGTEREGALVASYFAPADRTVLEGAAATPDAVLAALKGKTHWHFASHGSFSWFEPRSSGLIMHGGQPLTVGRLLDATDLGRPRLVVLSACETGLSDVRNVPDEFIGLPATFAALGAVGVVGTLWPVSDAATALLMAKFYELHLGSGKEPPTALREAQAWLRRATEDDLNQYAKVAAAAGRLQPTELAGIGRELRATHKDEPAAGVSTASTAASGIAPPYAHPYYWAAFIYTGQ